MAVASVASLLVASAIVAVPGGPPAVGVRPNQIVSVPGSPFSTQTVMEIRVARPIARPAVELLPATGDGTTLSFAIKVDQSEKMKAVLVWKQAIKVDGSRGPWEKFVDEIPFDVDGSGRTIVAVPGFDGLDGVRGYTVGVQAYLGSLPLPAIVPAPGLTDPAKTGSTSSK